MSDDYMCPFCVNPWKCNGPHIEPEDLANFDDFVRQWSEDMREACIAAVLAYADERLVITKNPNASMDITAALWVAADRLRAVQP